MKKRRLLALALGIALIVGITACSNSDGDDLSGDSDSEVVKIGLSPYPQIEVVSAIFESAYQELGYETEIVEGDIGFIYLGVSQGDIDVNPDGWLPVLHGNYIERYGDKLDVGEKIYEEVSMGITVPAYMEDINTIEDLKNNADLFENRIVGIEPSAGIMLTARETLEVYDMEDELEILESSTPAMLAEVDTAIRAEEPVAFLGWRPHVMFSEYDIKILEDDKGIWSADDVLSITNPDLKERLPEAYEFAQKFKITVEDIENIMAEAKESGMTNSEVAKKWFEENREVLDEMLD